MEYQQVDKEENEDAARARRRKRIEEAKRRKRRQMIFRRLVRKLALPAAGIIAVCLIAVIGRSILHKPSAEVETGTENSQELSLPDRTENESAPVETQEAMQESSTQQPEEEAEKETAVYSAETTADTKQLGGDIISSHAIVIDADSDSILAQKDAKTTINPASMTKVLTVLVAAEHVENLDDTFTITHDITDFSYVNDCSNVGFAENETVTVRDLFYGTILPSGADAAVGLAVYVAGSQEAFVELMNKKLEELGLSDTAHFTNCVGIYDTGHYCSVYDMAIILEAAIQNELCREVLSAHTYTTTKTTEHPEGLGISNWFLRRIEDKDAGGEVICGKTGYVVQSGNCAASFGMDENGRRLICVTSNANSGWRCIYDHVALYKQFFEAG